MLALEGSKLRGIALLMGFKKRRRKGYGAITRDCHFSSFGFVYLPAVHYSLIYLFS
jgi:hypothetical protein